MKNYSPFFCLLVPLIWGASSYFHHYYPGDEKGMWLLSSVAGLWVAPFVFISGASDTAAAAGITVAGVIVLVPIGFAMDIFHVRRLFWVILFPVCSLAVLVAAIMSFPSIERAISKNGSWWAYIFFSINIGIYLSIILSSILTLTVKLLKFRSKDK